MSSLGQGVIPEELRDEMHLESGTAFVVFGKGDSLLLKKLEFSEPSRAFEEMSKWASQHAKEKGFEVSPQDIVAVQHRRRRLRG